MQNGAKTWILYHSRGFASPDPGAVRAVPSAPRRAGFLSRATDGAQLLSGFNSRQPAQSTGIRFLGINLGNNTDFTIVDSGLVRNGVLANQVQGGNGCLDQDFSDAGDHYPGCSGNPATYCFADIQFKPVDFGQLTPNVTFVATCPGAETNNVPASCVFYPPGEIFDYQVNPVKLTAFSSGFGVTQPSPNANFSLASPANAQDPGVSPPIPLAASVDGGADVTWTTTLRYKPTDQKEVGPVTNHPTGNPTSLSFGGSGGFCP